MEERTKTLAATALIIGFLLLIAVGIGIAVSGKKVVSPIPEESAIKIIFITPAPKSSAREIPTIPISSTPKKR